MSYKDYRPLIHNFDKRAYVRTKEQMQMFLDDNCLNDVPFSDMTPWQVVGFLHVICETFLSQTTYSYISCKKDIQRMEDELQDKIKEFESINNV